jgi:hypothetical protein
MIARLFLVFATALGTAPVAAAQDDAASAAAESLAGEPVAAAAAAAGMAPGEEIEWRVDYLGVKTGKARLTLGRSEGDIWPVICQAKTEGVAKVLDIREHFVSYWNAPERLSRGTDLEALEIGDHHKEKARFDRAEGKATVVRWRKGKERRKVVDVPRDVHDLASAMMWLRLQPLEPGTRYELPVFTGSKTFTLRAAVAARESVDTPLGEMNTVRVDLVLGFEDKFRTDRPSHVWFSDDLRHIPVKMSAEFAIGSVVATMTTYTPGGQVARR